MSLSVLVIVLIPFFVEQQKQIELSILMQLDGRLKRY